MKTKVIRSIGKTAAKRVAGLKVGALPAQLASAVVGLGAGVATYKLLRSNS